MTVRKGTCQLFYDRLRIYHQRVAAYCGEAVKFASENPQRYSLREMLVRFWPWFASLRYGANPMRDATPWMTFSAIDFLDGVLNKNMRVFEYGSGGSTIFFARRCGEVHSVEHDRDWFNSVQAELHRKKYYNCRLTLRLPGNASPDAVYSPSRPAECLSDDPRFIGRSFENYVHSIDAYPDGFFDVVIIDGRARNSCFVVSRKKVRTGGFIVWDNTDRVSYSSLVGAAHDGLEFMDFPGPSPYVDFFTRTSVWRKVHEGGDAS